MFPHDSVSEDVALNLVVPGDETLALQARLRYQPNDPYAVEATFRAGAESIAWVLSRELLSAGLRAPSGEGDVRAWPASVDGADLVMIQLRSAQGNATLGAQARALAGFLARTYELVPRGQETRHLELDDVVEQLLS